MKFDQFIARRIGKSHQGGFSAKIMAIAIVAVALSVAVMIITTNVTTGFKHEISNKVFNFWGHIHVTDTNADQTYEIVSIDADQKMLDAIKDIQQIRYKLGDAADQQSPMLGEKVTYGGVSHVQKYVVLPAIISDRTSFEGILLRGVGADFDSSRILPFVQRGRWIDYNQSEGTRDIVISDVTAKRMQLDVGSRLILNFIIEGDPVKRAFTVSGVYKTGLEEYDRSFALADIRTLQEILQWSEDKISGLEIFVDDLRDMELINEYIYLDVLPPNLYSQSVRTKYYQIFEWLDLQDINERVIFILMTLVAIINMATALLIFVLERTKMIGILKALGATNWQIRKIFLYSAIRIVLQGVLLGNLLSLGLCIIQLKWGIFTLPESDYYLSKVPIEFNVVNIIGINIASFVLIMACMLLPSLVVAQISPVKTIQYK